MSRLPIESGFQSLRKGSEGLLGHLTDEFVVDADALGEYRVLSGGGVRAFGIDLGTYLDPVHEGQHILPGQGLDVGMLPDQMEKALVVFCDFIGRLGGAPAAGLPVLGTPVPDRTQAAPDGRWR